MQRRTIKKILERKFNFFLASIKDEEVKKLVKKNAILTGGAIVSLLLDEKPNDYDIYFADKETVKAVAEYYVKQFQEAHKDKYNISVVEEDYDPDKYDRENTTEEIIEEKEDADDDIQKAQGDERVRINVESKGFASENDDDHETTEIVKNFVKEDKAPKDATKQEKYRPVCLSSNAITLSNKVQLIIRFWGTPGEIHKNYDFVHTACYWTPADNNLILPADAIEAILTKELKYVGSLYPLASMVRVRKFVQRGWKIHAGQFLKMAFQIKQLDLFNYRVLEEQLTGLDSNYFGQIIEILGNKIEKDVNFKITENYVAELINRIFG